MTMRPLCIRHLVFTGPNKEPAEMRFAHGLNVVYGASDTGKSFILESIDFMLGGQGPLRDIPERVGYDRVAMGIDDADGRSFTLLRASSGGNFQLVEGLHDSVPPSVEPRVLASRHNADSEETVSTFLLGLIGLQGRRVRVNKKDETNSLSFRNLCQLTLVNEGQIQKQGSPIESGQVIQRTRELSVFKLLLTGVDDSSLISSSRAAAASQSTSAKIEMLTELIDSYMSRITEDDPTEAELQEQLRKLEASLKREQKTLDSSEENYASLVDQRSDLRRRVRAGADRRAEIRELLARFELLDTHYRSDLKRLEGLIEAGILVEALTAGTCPLCGAAPEHHNRTVDCDGDVSLVVAAGTAERAKIERLRIDLAETVRQLRLEAGSFDRVVPSLNEKLNSLEKQIEVLLPVLSERRSAYSDFVEKRATVQSALTFWQQITDLEARRLALEGGPDIDSQGGNNETITELSSSTLDKFSRIIESILKDWHFPEPPRVHFEQSIRDIVIAGKQRGSRGKGMRAVTHAAFTVGLLEYCRQEQNPHPGFLVLDSPLLAYREPESDDDDLRGTDVQDHIYRYLANLNSGTQSIVIENVDPPGVIQSREQTTLFSRNIKVGRYGFFPPAKASPTSQA